MRRSTAAPCRPRACRRAAIAPSPGATASSAAASKPILRPVGEPGGCAWTASSDASWLTFPSDLTSGTNGRDHSVHRVAERLRWPAHRSNPLCLGRRRHLAHRVSGRHRDHQLVHDDGSVPLGHYPTTECHFRSTPRRAPSRRRPTCRAATTCFTWTAIVLLRHAENHDADRQRRTSSRSPTRAAARIQSATGNHGDLDVTRSRSPTASAIRRPLRPAMGDGSQRYESCALRARDSRRLLPRRGTSQPQLVPVRSPGNCPHSWTAPTADWNS